MDLVIITKGFELTSALREHIESRATLSLDRFQDKIQRVQVLLRDENGPKGGIDKKCKVLIDLNNGSRIVRDITSQDGYKACTEAFARASRALASFSRRSRNKEQVEFERRPRAA